MIRAECLIFAGMLVAGAIAGAVAAFLLLLGKGSRLARACCDLLAPLAVGAFFFFAEQDFAQGAFRLYALAAFLTGILASRAILKKISPFARRVLRKILLPMKSLAYTLEDRVNALLEPWRAKRRARREKRALLRSEKRAERARKRAEQVRKRAERSSIRDAARPSRKEEWGAGEGERSVVIYRRRGRRKREDGQEERPSKEGGERTLGCQSD